MRLTSQVISDAPIIINPEKQVTIQLRGLKIPYLENLGITRDKFEVIDLTDNELIELSNLPKLNNLKVLLVANNNITGINNDNLPTNLPHLQTISFINNNINKFSDIYVLSKCKRLTNVTFIGNPIAKMPNYRYLIIWLIPTLKVLDFSKVKQQERMKAEELFGKSYEKPTELASSILATADSKYAMSEAVSKDESSLSEIGKKLNNEDKEKLLAELETAESLEDIERIEKSLQSGHMLPYS